MNAITKIPLPVLTELFVRADKDAGNGDYRLEKKEWSGLFQNKTLYADTLKTYKNGDIQSLVSDDRFKGDPNAQKRAKIESNFKNADGFNSIRTVMGALSADPNMQTTLFDYGLAMQAKNHGKLNHQPIQSSPIIDIYRALSPKKDFDTHNVPDGIHAEGTRSDTTMVTGLQWDAKNPGWTQTVSTPAGAIQNDPVKKK